VDRLTGIEVFLAVARSEGFSAAANELGLSKAMVSKHVSRLEAKLGVRLLNRTTRRVGLTEAGAAYRDRMKELLQELEEAEQSVSKLSTEPRGTLRVVAPTSFGSFHLARALADYRVVFPEVDIDLVLTDRPADLVEEGLDLAIRVGDLEDSTLVARRLAQTRVVVCGAPRYLHEFGRPQHPDDLRQHNCLGYTGRQLSSEWSFTIDGKVRMNRLAGHVRSNIGDALRVAAIQGAGLVQMPTYMVGLDIAGGRLEAVLEAFEPPPRPVYATYLYRRYLSAKVRTFVNFLSERFYPTPYWEHWTKGPAGSVHGG
jgi:DNA-binding transcriptional LysR family regulator